MVLNEPKENPVLDIVTSSCAFPSNLKKEAVHMAGRSSSVCVCVCMSACYARVHPQSYMLYDNVI